MNLNCPIVPLLTGALQNTNHVVRFKATPIVDYFGRKE